ncbi:MAG: transglycosylase SLT domain-containing protein [Candidatus Promineifilaceae bacterium]|nr:transglycosylase SLT domain-containing protein [Chloroflexota bacterium]
MLPGSLTRRLLQLGLLALVLTLLVLPGQTAVAAVTVAPVLQEPDDVPTISAIWGPGVQQWAFHIGVLAKAHGLDPDFIAAVINEESDGNHQATSQKGAVGLMGVMPTGPGLEWRPSADDLANPAINLRWGVAILADVVRQAGGDLYAALAAYSGGWANVNNGVPRSYATSVLDNYGRAVAARNNISPDIATQWTVAITIRYGNVPNESLLILGDQPISGLYTFGEHVVYDYVDDNGRAYYVLGYAVPVALVAPVENDTVIYGDSESVDAYLRARLGGDGGVKAAGSNPQVLLACLPSLDRLRGHASTRWFAPSDCPDWHR